MCFNCNFVQMKIHESSSLTVNDVLLKNVQSLRLASVCSDDVESITTENSCCCNADMNVCVNLKLKKGVPT